MRGPLVRGLAFTAGGSAAVAVVSLVRNVLIAGVMGPAAFGLWNLCVVALRIATEGHLGALSAVAQDVPIRRGAGRVEEACALERRGTTATVLLALAAGAACAGMLRLAGGPPLATAAALLAATVVLQQQFFADATVLRSRGRFRRMAALQVAFAAVHLAGLLLLLRERYLTGVLAAWSAGLAAAIVLARVRTAEAMPRLGSGGVAGMGALLARGAPTWLVGVTFTLLLQADRVVVGALLGAEPLGHYGLLVIGASALLFLPDAFAGALWPLAGERFGASGADVSVLRGVTATSLRVMALALAGVLAASLVATDLLVARVLPHFAPALPAARPYLAGVYLLALALPLRFLLVTVGAERAVLRAQVAALALAVLAETAAAAAGLGIRGVALASAAASVLLLASLLRLATARGLLARGAAVRLGLATGALLAAALALDAAIAMLRAS